MHVDEFTNFWLAFLAKKRKKLVSCGSDAFCAFSTLYFLITCLEQLQAGWKE
jgi:hypothetical protein